MDPATDPKSRETTKDIDIFEKEQNCSQIHESFNQLISQANLINRKVSKNSAFL